MWRPTFTRTRGPAYTLIVFAIALASVPAASRGRALAESNGSPALAVVETDKELAPLAALLTAQLSQEGVRLVERKQLDAVLQEQALSAAGLTDRANLVKVGALVRADAFVLLSREEAEGGDLIRLRVAETAHGVRLLDALEEWDPKEVEAAAALLSGQIKGAVAKLSLPPGKLTAVGIVSIHRVQLGPDKEWVARTLEIMLSARLSLQPGIVVLEREDLERLREENLLTRGEAGGLLHSVVLVDGSLQSADGGMALAVRARAAGGQALADLTVPVTTSDLDGAVSAVAARLLDVIAAGQPTAAWDAKGEAAEFYRKGLLLRVHGRWQQSSPLMETAYALDPQNQDYILAFFGAGNTREDPDGKAERATLAVGALAKEAELADWSRFSLYLRSTIGVAAYLCSPDASATDRAADVNRQNRRLLREVFKKEPFSTTGRSVWDEWSAAMDRADARASGGAELTKLDLFRRCVLPPERGGEYSTWAERFAATEHAFPDPRTLAMTPRDPGEQEPAFLDGLVRLADDADPLVRFFACRELVSAPVGLMGPAPDLDLGVYERSMVHTFAAELQTSGQLSQDALSGMRREVFDAAMAVRGRPGDAEWFDLIEELVEPILKARDADALASLATWLRPRVPGDDAPETDARYLELLTRARAVLEPRVGERDVRSALEYLERASLATTGGWRGRLRTERNPDMAERIRQAFPVLLAERHVPAPPVRMLVRKDDWPAKWGVGYLDVFVAADTELVGGTLWLCLADTDGLRVLRLAGIDLETGQPLALWQVSFDTPAKSSIPTLRGMVIGEDKTYLATGSRGLIELPGSRARGSGTIGRPRVLTEEDGLPSQHVTGIAPFGRKLWLAYGGHAEESGLGIYDPVARHYEMLFCSALDGEHPLSSGRLYDACELRSVDDGLLFCLSADDKAITPGLWWLSSVTRSAAPCVSFFAIKDSSRISDTGRGLLLANAGFLARLDEHAHTLTKLVCRSSVALAPASGSDWVVQNASFLPGAAEAPADGDWLGNALLNQLGVSSAAVHGDSMWAVSGDGRIAVLQRGKPLDEGDFAGWDLLPGDRVHRFVETPFGLVVVGAQSAGLIEAKDENWELNSGR